MDVYSVLMPVTVSIHPVVYGGMGPLGAATQCLPWLMLPLAGGSAFGVCTV